MGILTACCGLLLLCQAPAGSETKTLRMLQTPSGVRFGMLGDKGPLPAPTLFVFATDAQSAQAESYNAVGHLLAPHGFLSVSLDLPCHGADARAGEPGGLSGWRARLEKGEDLVSGFLSKVFAVRDFLVQERYADPRRIAACGTSRGGFIALHFAAADASVRCVVAFAPVTDLMALKEFSGMSGDQAAGRLSVLNIADRLAGRSLWMSIGHNDRRVSTDTAIAFARKAMEGDTAWKVKEGRQRTGAWTEATMKLVVVPSEGETGHSTYSQAHREAAAWVLDQMKGK